MQLILSSVEDDDVDDDDECAYCRSTFYVCVYVSYIGQCFMFCVVLVFKRPASLQNKLPLGDTNKNLEP